MTYYLLQVATKYRGVWLTCYVARASAQWFYLGSIPGQRKIMNVPVFYHEVNMVLGALFTNV